MAERLIKEGSLPLSNIAYYLGYADQSSFNHAFERWHGIAPSRWRMGNHERRGDRDLPHPVR